MTRRMSPILRRSEQKETAHDDRFWVAIDAVDSPREWKRSRALSTSWKCSGGGDDALRREIVGGLPRGATTIGVHGTTSTNRVGARVLRMAA
jgi:hypothetical protein